MTFLPSDSPKYACVHSLFSTAFNSCENFSTPATCNTTPPTSAAPATGFSNVRPATCFSNGFRIDRARLLKIEKGRSRALCKSRKIDPELSANRESFWQHSESVAKVRVFAIRSLLLYL